MQTSLTNFLKTVLKLKKCDVNKRLCWCFNKIMGDCGKKVLHGFLHVKLKKTFFYSCFEKNQKLSF